MRVMKKTSLLAFLIAVFCFACNKKDKELTRTEMLTGGNWKITAFMEDNDGDGSFETDYYSTEPACVKDDFFHFTAAGQLTADEGPTKCNPTDPQTDTVTWSFMTNETVLVIDGENFTIEELTNNTLRIKQVYPGLYGAQITFTKI